MCEWNRLKAPLLVGIVHLLNGLKGPGVVPLVRARAVAFNGDPLPWHATIYIRSPFAGYCQQGWFWPEEKLATKRGKHELGGDWGGGIWDPLKGL